MKLFRKLSRLIPDRIYLQIVYFKHFRRFINFNNPKTFNEKIQWLKLNYRNEEYTKLVDKYRVKQYITKLIGEEYVIPTLGVWNNVDDIDFKSLPEKFVLKCNNDSGGIVICKNKKDFDEAKAKSFLKERLKNNGYWYGREWPYKNVKPCIIAEKYMEDSISKDIKDYKFFCFNGSMEFFDIDIDRFIEHRANYYDRNGNFLPFGKTYCPPDYTKKIEMPKNLDKMIELAETISHNTVLSRIDFYEIDGQVYFGEITFYPGSGFSPFTDEKWDYKLGDMIDLPNIKK
ncbi:MAG: ATP-grasp fold amidoligase family protein [Clostridia bacterium]|jgi:glycosyltransferase